MPLLVRESRLIDRAWAVAPNMLRRAKDALADARTREKTGSKIIIHRRALLAVPDFILAARTKKTPPKSCGICRATSGAAVTAVLR